MLPWAYGHRCNGIPSAACDGQQLEYAAVSRSMPRDCSRDEGTRGTVTYSPVLDVVRDSRWGRTEETFGEDPYLIGEMAVAAVEGLQGESIASGDTVIATLKHFAGYGSSEGGRNAAPARIGARELLEKDLLPFERAVQAVRCRS